MPQVTLEKTKHDKLLSRLMKRGGDGVKQLSKTILNNAAEATKRQAANKANSSKEASKDAHKGPTREPPKPPRSTTYQVPPEIAIQLAKGTSVSTPVAKRERDGGTKEVPSAKRVTTAVNQKTVAVPQVKRTVSAPEKSALENKTPANASAGVKPKAKVTVSAKPPPSLFSSLMSSTTKPTGTSNSARAAAAAKEKTR